MIIGDGDDYTKNTPDVEYPHLKYIYNMLSVPANVEYAYFPDEKHPFPENAIRNNDSVVWE